jgi:Flp pilus assembly protein TadD
MPQISEQDLPTSKWFRVAIICVSVLAAYGNSIRGKFAFDDEVLIEARPAVHGFDIFGLLDSDRPFLLLTFAINYAFGQLDTTGYHIVNITIHMAAAITLYLLIKRVLTHINFADEKYSNWVSLSIALIWAVHPLQTQSVTYIVQRGESLCGLFYLLCLLLTFSASTATKHRGWYQSAVVVCCTLGMFTKGVMITAPLTILLFDSIVLRSAWRTIFRRRGAMYGGLLGAALLYVLHMKFNCNSGTALLETIDAATPLEYLCTQAIVIVQYLKLSIWPQHLCIDYNWPISRDLMSIVGCGLIVVSLLATAVYAVLKKMPIGFVLGFFFLVLAPTSSFLPILDVAFEHRMYLPLVSVVTVGVVGLFFVLKTLVTNETWFERAYVSVIAVVSLCLILRTHYRNDDYVHPEQLWESAIVVAPTNARAHFNLGFELQMQNKLDDARGAYRRACELNPNDIRAFFHLAAMQHQTGRRDAAILGYQKVIAMSEKHSRAHLNLARLLEETSQFDLSEQHYRQAIDLAQNDPGFVEMYGNYFARRGQFEKAISQYRIVMARSPTYVTVHLNLALALQKLGRSDEATVHLKRASRQFPHEHRIQNQIAKIR